MKYARYPEYRASGIDWLGEIPAHWDVKRLRFLAETNPLRSGLTGLDDDALVSFVPMDAVGEFGGLDLERELSLDEVGSGYTYFADGDVVVAKITPCFENNKGALAEGLSNGVAFGTTELHVLRAGPLLDQRYMFYLSMAYPFRNIGESEMYGAGGQKRISEEFIRDFRAPLPPIDEQSVIADFLDRKTAQIDKLISSKHRFLGVLQDKRIALITNAFTRGFDPVVRLRPSGVSWLGEIPDHWKIKRLKFALDNIQQGWSPQCDNQPADDGQWGVLKAGCVNGGGFDSSENKALPPDLEPIAALEIRSGDVLMSRANTRELLGSAAYVSDVRPMLLLCDKLYRLRVKPEVSPKYVAMALSASFARYQFEREATGASGSMQNIGQDVVSNVIFPIPPLCEQEAIVARLEAELGTLNDLRNRVENVVSKLQEARSSLIANAITGSRDVRVDA